MHNNIYASRKPKRNTIWNRRSRRKTYTSPLRGYMFDALINSSCTTTSTWRNIYDLYNSFFFLQTQRGSSHGIFFFSNATWIFSWYGYANMKPTIENTHRLYIEEYMFWYANTTLHLQLSGECGWAAGVDVNVTKMATADVAIHFSSLVP
jgi:hypothetical protein